jgi:hypothetical protein
VFMESDFLDPLFRGIEEIIGAPIAPIILTAPRRARARARRAPAPAAHLPARGRTRLHGPHDPGGGKGAAAREAD